MDHITRIKKFVVKKEFSFQGIIFRGRFTVKSLNEKELPYELRDSLGKYKKVINLTIDLHTCEWFTKLGTWYSPHKGFRTNKNIANKHIRVLIEKEVMSMINMLSVPHRIDKIKINWLHED
jgi:hypothetical protein